jgi:hypothetical protein
MEAVGVVTTSPVGCELSYANEGGVGARLTAEVKRSRTRSRPGILLRMVLVSRRQVRGAIEACGIHLCLSLRHICKSADLVGSE